MYPVCKLFSINFSYKTFHNYFINYSILYENVWECGKYNERLC
jgi:hypothetical protein